MKNRVSKFKGLLLQRREFAVLKLFLSSKLWIPAFAGMTGWGRHGLALLALLAVLAQGVVPAGMMPEAAAPLRMVICSGTGVKTIDVAPGRFGSGGVPAHGHEKMAPCAYAVAAHMGFAGLEDGVAVPPVGFAGLGLVLLFDLRVVARVFFGNAAVRAPPVFF